MDRYETALKALIEDKKKGHKPAQLSSPEDTNVIDLMSALRASLGAKNPGAATKPKSAGARKAGPSSAAPKARRAK